MKQSTLGANLVLEERPQGHGGVEVTAREATEQQDARQQSTTDRKGVSNKGDHTDQQKSSKIFSSNNIPHLVFYTENET